MYHRDLFRPLVLLLLLVAAVGCAGAPPPPSETPSERAEWVDHAVVYEVFVRDFTPEGTFRAIIPRLPELKSLGVTTLWLMPIHPIGEEKRKGELGSPYSIRDFYAVNPDFGTEEDFRGLVEAVHDQGMYLLLDLVANHTAWDNPWVTQHPDWYTRDSTGQIVSPDPDWTDVADLNFDRPEVREEMKRVMRYWVEEFDIDGYRCDVAWGVPGDFWMEAIRELRSIKPVLMLAEADDPRMHDYGFDLTYGWPFYHKMKEVWEGAPSDSLSKLVASVEAALPEGGQRLRFTTNHDETAWDAPPIELFNGVEGAKAAAVLSVTLPGVPLLYNGQEAGNEVALGLFEKMAIDWEAHPELRTFYTDLLGLYHGSEAIRDGSLTLLPEVAGRDALAYELVEGEERIFVAVNVRDRAISLTRPTSLDEATLQDAFTGQEVADEQVALAPYGYRILRVAGGGS